MTTIKIPEKVIYNRALEKACKKLAILNITSHKKIKELDEIQLLFVLDEYKQQFLKEADKELINEWIEDLL
jgi:hypothetical protein